VRTAAAFLVVFVLAGAASSGDDSGSADDGAANATNGVVVHGVDTKLLAARLREVDKKVLAGDAKAAAADLAEILAGDATPLVDEGGDTFLCAREACLQRIAALPPDGLAAYRATVDERAASVLADATSRGDATALARRAPSLALSTHGPKMLVALADLRAARGDVRLAAQALSDLLRLWPESGGTAVMPGVDRASVVLRLATLFAATGDESGVWWLARETSPALVAGPSPATPGAKLSDDLARCAASAAKRAAPPAGPTGDLQVAAELRFGSAGESDGRPSPSQSREIDERPLAIGTAEHPMLLTRETGVVRTPPRVLALAPDGSGALAPIWSFPSDEERRAALRRGGRGPFQPARCGDLVLFPWPTEPSAPAASGSPESGADDEENTLVMLSISGEGRLVDERGDDDEKKRDDGDLGLVAKLDDSGEIARAAPSFVGRPLVVGTSVFTTLVRRAENGGSTELHVARFDIVPDGASFRLRERWRRHVLDGETMGPFRYPTDHPDFVESLTTPSPPAERCGRIYVTSDTGAVACLDCEDGRPEWVVAYPRFGPTDRHPVLPADPMKTAWHDLPAFVDGPFVWAAPRDADYLFEFRAMPRSARTTLVQKDKFLGNNGTSTEEGPLLAGLTPCKVIAVKHGVGWIAGAADARPGAPPLVPDASPLATYRFRDASPGEPRRARQNAQIQESAVFGSPSVVDGALLFPTAKAIYRVPAGDFEGVPRALFRPASRGAWDQTDQIGNLVVDGARVWSVTPRRVVLLEPAK